MESPMKLDDLGVYPDVRKPYIYIYTYTKREVSHCDPMAMARQAHFVLAED